MNLKMTNTLALVTFILMQGFAGFANASEDRVSPGFCGSMGCDEWPSRIQTVSAIFNHPDLERSLDLELGSKIESIDIQFKEIDDLLLIPKSEAEVNLVVTHSHGQYAGMSYRCAKVIFTRSKSPVNGNKPVKIGKMLGLISFEGGSCD